MHPLSVQEKLHLLKHFFCFYLGGLRFRLSRAFSKTVPEVFRMAGPDGESEQGREHRVAWPAVARGIRAAGFCLHENALDYAYIEIRIVKLADGRGRGIS